jgi:predicted aldo/keto reductase-like oxidoreductase
MIELDVCLTCTCQMPIPGKITIPECMLKYGTAAARSRQYFLYKYLTSGAWIWYGDKILSTLFVGQCLELLLGHSSHESNIYFSILLEIQRCLTIADDPPECLR